MLESWIQYFIISRIDCSVYSIDVKVGGKGLGIKLLFARLLLLPNNHLLFISYLVYVSNRYVVSCKSGVAFFSSRRTENINQNLTLHLPISITFPHTSLQEKLLF